MKIRIQKLEVQCKQIVEIINFSDISYFYGEIGSGKSTIARLVDFCLGGDLVNTPAIQSEFISAVLHLEINSIKIELSRDYMKSHVTATWEVDGEQQLIELPVGSSNEPRIKETAVCNLSDFLFYLAGINPPKIQRSRIREESSLQRITFANLFVFCYLDQDSMDSSFFDLDDEGGNWRKLTSQNAFRYILGFHQEKVAELEYQRSEYRRKRDANISAAETLSEALSDSEFSSLAEIDIKIIEEKNRLVAVEKRLKQIKSNREPAKNHVIDENRHRAQAITGELENIETAISEINNCIAKDTSHLHEIQNLSTKTKRLASARSILNGVEYSSCPRCLKELENAHPDGKCTLCGQDEPNYQEAENEIELVGADIKSREKELNEILSLQKKQLKRMHQRQNELVAEKEYIDQSISKALRQYDSAYLASVLDFEKRVIIISKDIEYIEHLKVLPEKISSLKQKAELLSNELKSINEELNKARELAESDTKNLDKLKTYFLDCLVRSKLSGFNPGNFVKITNRKFSPEVFSSPDNDFAARSFSDIGSGGLKTIFKCCYAIALHRLAVEIDAVLPSIMIIDSPMKNVSERENKEQFEAFHNMVYELAETELKETQFMLIDKEHCSVQEDFSRTFFERHMKPESEEFPPLISYYREPSNPEQRDTSDETINGEER